MLDPKKQEKIDEIFIRACHVPESELNEFLRDACGNDPEIRLGVERLIAADKNLKSDEFLANSPDELGSPLGTRFEGTPGADRNLLFGILAVQMSFIDRDALINAMNDWVLQKSTPIEDILVSRGDLTEETRSLLAAVVIKHLEMHGQQPEKSLAALSSVEDVKSDLESIGDFDLQKLILQLAEDDSLPPGATVSFGQPTEKGGRFRVLRPHKKGGLGAVSVALDEELNREVALKEVRQKYAENEMARDRLRIEAEITGGLEHPGIVPVYGLGNFENGRPFYCMRFIRGDSLKDAIYYFHKYKDSLNSTARNLELRGLIRRFTDVCDAMSYAHSRRILHRDLKPGNIMLGKYGETLVVDWGLAKATATEPNPDYTELPVIPRSGSTAAPTLAGSTIGTPEYMSPEQAEGRLDKLGPATDIYSLGATLYAVLTGRSPATGDDTTEKLANVISGNFPLPTEIDKSIPKGLEAICLKGMQLKPGDRYKSATQMAEDVERWLADEPVSVYPDPFWDSLGRFSRKHRAAVLAVASILLTGLIGLAIANYVVRNKNIQLTDLNTELTELNSELSVAKTQLEEDFENTKKLAFDLVAHGEDSLAQIPKAQKHRLWVTNEAIRVFQPLRERYKDDDVVALKLAELYKKAANLDRLGGNYDEAAGKYQTAIEMLETSNGGNPESGTRSKLAQILSDYAPMLRLAGRLVDSKEQLEMSEQIIKELRADYPDRVTYVRTEGLVAMEFAAVLAELTEPESALERSRKCTENFRELVAGEKKGKVDDLLLLLSLAKDTELLLELDRLDEAEEVARDAVELAASAAEANPTRGGQHVLAKANLQLGRVLAQRDAEFEAVAAPIETAIATWQPIVDKFPDSRIYPEYLAKAKTLLGKVKAANAKVDAGRKDIEAAIEILNAAIEKQKEKISLPETLADALLELALVERLQGDPTKSASLFKDAIEQIDISVLRDPENLRLKKKQELFKTKINDLRN